MSMSQAEQLRIADRFRLERRETLAHLQDVDESLISFLQLNYTSEELAALDGFGYRKALDHALITLIDNGGLRPIVPFGEQAQNDIIKLRRSTGVGSEKLPPPAPKAPTAQELLEAEVIADYNGGLSATKMREKCNSNKKYNETFIRLAEGNQLESRITSNVRAGA